MVSIRNITVNFGVNFVETLTGTLHQNLIEYFSVNYLRFRFKMCVGLRKQNDGIQLIKINKSMSRRRRQ